MLPPLFPFHLLPYDHAHQNALVAINQMITSCHSPTLITLQHEVAFFQQDQHLKRYYCEWQFQSKINMLSEYYQYHRELPRIFLQQLRDTIDYYQEDVRQLEYQTVTKKIKNSTNNHQQTPQPRLLHKIIQGVDLSYYDFQNKANTRVEKIFGNKKSVPCLPLYQQQPPRPHKKSTVQVHALKQRDGNRPVSRGRDLKGEVGAKEAVLQTGRQHKIQIGRQMRAQLGRQQGQKIMVRSKSKPIMIGIQAARKGSIRTSCEGKHRNNVISLQKTKSFKSIGLMGAIRNGKGQGVKGMFKKAVNAKKMIKLER